MVIFTFSQTIGLFSYSGALFVYCTFFTVPYSTYIVIVCPKSLFWKILQKFFSIRFKQYGKTPVQTVEFRKKNINSKIVVDGSSTVLLYCTVVLPKFYLFDIFSIHLKGRIKRCEIEIVKSCQRHWPTLFQPFFNTNFCQKTTFRERPATFRTHNHNFLRFQVTYCLLSSVVVWRAAQ